MENPTRFAWAKLNAYGIILAGLALLGAADLYHPAGSSLARVLGEVPPGQAFWSTGFAISGLLLMYGFARADRLAESIALGLLFGCVVVQTVVSYHLLGWTDYTFTRLAIVVLVGLAGGARVSALWSRTGLVVTIPPRGVRR